MEGCLQVYGVMLLGQKKICLRDREALELKCLKTAGRDELEEKIGACKTISYTRI